MPQENVKILWNKTVSPSVMHMGISSDDAGRLCIPGQFVMLKADRRNDPLLRRPFSIHQVIVENGKRVGLELLYKVVGPVTERLASMEQGETINLVAPLGQGFDLPEQDGPVILCAGGIGVAPLVFLASWLVENGVEASRCRVMLGGRSQDDVLCADRFESMGMGVETATDDGSMGHHGRVTELVQKTMGLEKPAMIYSCGPHPMLATLADMAQKADAPCQLSMETLMACGICACMGCAVEQKDDKLTYKHVCKNGPVFEARELTW